MAKQKQPQDEQLQDQLAQQAPVEPQEEEREEEPQKRLTRQQCAIQVVGEIVGDTTLDELAKKADDLYVAGGGKSNVDSASWRVYDVLQTAAALGAVELKEVFEVHVTRKGSK